MWAEAAACTVHVANCSPTKILKDTVPIKAFTGKKPDVSHVRVFGSGAYVHEHGKGGGKLEARFTRCIMVGYYDNYTYQCWDPIPWTIIKSCDVILEEGHRHRTLTPNDIATDFAEIGGFSDTDTAPQLGTIADVPTEPEPAPTPQPPVLCRSTRNIQIDYSDNDEIGREIDRAKDEHREPVLPMQSGFLSYGAAMKHPMADAFRKAMEKEWDNLIAIGAVRAVDKPPSATVLPNLWICNFKTDRSTKGRLVLEGSQQVPGVDFDGSMTWAGIVIWSSVRCILAEATREGRLIVVTDFAAAYLNVELDGSTYMRQPRGFEIPGEPLKVYQLLRNLYGFA